MSYKVFQPVLGGRPLGSGEGLLVDLPWALVGFFCPGSALRGAAPREGSTLRFEHSGELARPSKVSAVNAADHWIRFQHARGSRSGLPDRRGAGVRCRVIPNTQNELSLPHPSVELQAERCRI